MRARWKDAHQLWREEGGASAPAEWLRLTIDPRTPEVFSWENVVYCANPAVSCP